MAGTVRAKSGNPVCRRTRLPTGPECGCSAVRLCNEFRQVTLAVMPLSPPHRQVTWQLQKRACSRGPDLHTSPASFDAPTNLPPMRTLKASTCREIVGPPTRCPRTPGRCPGPWQSRGRRRFGLVFSRASRGGFHQPIVFNFRVCSENSKRCSHVVPGPVSTLFAM